MRKFVLFIIAVLAASFLPAADYYKNDRQKWLDIAAKSAPDLKYSVVRPTAVLKAVEDPSVFQGWRFEKIGNPDDLYKRNFQAEKSVILDFGKHYTGYFTFSTKILKRVMDAPVRLKFHFAELPAELNTPLEPWKSSLARS